MSGHPPKKVLKVVELSRLGQKDMDKHIGIVHGYPLVGSQTDDIDRLLAELSLTTSPTDSVMASTCEGNYPGK